MSLSVPPFFRRWRGVNAFTRHAIVLVALGIMLLGSVVGGHLLGAFAQSPCARGDASYNVQYGDTLSAIAARYRLSWQRLASYNHLANANLIFPGQLICIPGNNGSNGGGVEQVVPAALVARTRIT